MNYTRAVNQTIQRALSSDIYEVKQNEPFNLLYSPFEDVVHIELDPVSDYAKQYNFCEAYLFFI